MPDKITEDQKRLFDALFELYQTAWKQFNERRAYEFKISLTFWAALAAAIAGSLRLKNLPGSRFTLILVSLFVFALHWIWCRGIGEAQRAERKIAFFYERELQKIAGVEFDEDLSKFLDSLKGTMGLLTNWTYRFQLGVTAFLGMALIVANWDRFGQFSRFEFWTIIPLFALSVLSLPALLILSLRKRANKASADSSSRSAEQQSR
jgi:hypothetical protein